MHLMAIENQLYLFRMYLFYYQVVHVVHKIKHIIPYTGHAIFDALQVHSLNFITLCQNK